MSDIPLILAIDAGSFSIRCTLFGYDGAAVASGSRRIEHSTPAPDWHEQDAEQIWGALVEVLAELAADYDLGRVAAVGLANQRGTCMLWDRANGEPLGPVISWSDRRMEPFVAALRDAGHALLVQVTTGAPLHSFYSAPKLRWMLDNLTGAGGLLAVGQLAGGTLDSWLLWRLSGGQAYATDYSNAQRTLLLNLATLRWEPELARLFSVPLDILPAPRNGVGVCGTTDLPELPRLRAPIGAIAGDQTAALLGHGALEPGATKCSYGTSVVPMIFCGPNPVGAPEGLAVIAYAADGATAYGISTTIAGGALALEWCCSRLGAFASVEELVALAATASADEGVIFVPAFAGLTRDPSARAAILGLHIAADRSTIARAALESIAFQVADALALLREVSGVTVTRLLVDGGLARSDLLMQIQADLLGIAVERPAQGELASLGIAYLAARGSGIPIDAGFLERGRGAARSFAPRLDEAGRQRRMALWHAGVERAGGWA
jgi:glycerol kinase